MNSWIVFGIIFASIFLFLALDASAFVCSKDWYLRRGAKRLLPGMGFYYLVKYGRNK